MRILLGVLLASAVTGAAVAAPVSDTADPPLVHSVWSVDERALIHLQSGLACPVTLGEFKRGKTAIFDGVGLDVGCNYGASGAALTIYMVRKTPVGVAEAMASARAEYLAGGAELNPKLLADEQVAEGGLTWTVARYAEEGDRRSDIWVTGLGEWVVTYRTTATPAGRERTEAGVKAMTANLLASAGPGLAACARAKPVARNGRLARNRKENEADALMSAILGGGLMMAAREKAEKGEQADDEAVEPIVWCPIQVADRGGFRLLYWRSVRMNGEDALGEKATLVTRDEPPTLSIAVDGMTELVRDSKGPPRWTASIAQGDNVTIYAYFDDRPKVDDALSLTADVLSGKAKPIGGYGVGGDSSITITLPSK